MTLVDTSAWVAFLRADGSSADQVLTGLLEGGAPIRITDTVVAELLAGARDERAARDIERLIASLDRCAPLGPADLQRAAALFRTVRAAGAGEAPLSACLVAAAALRDELDVLAADPAFELLARHGGPSLHPGVAPSPPGPAPSAAPPSAPPPPPAPADAPEEPNVAIILVVEDEPSAARMLQDTLTRPDRRIVVAATAREARLRIADSAPDLIVLDLILPDEDGRRLLADLRRDPDARDTGVVVVTGKAGPRTREECFGLGADWFFDKPFDAAALAEAVEHLVVEGRSDASEPDPLGTPLTLSELQKLLSSRREEDDATTPWTVALLEIDTDPGGTGKPAEADSSGPAGPTPLLPRLLRTVIEALSREVGAGELVARWGVDELVVVSRDRDEDDMRGMLDRIGALPGVSPYLESRVRRVGRDEDLLDAVSGMASMLLRDDGPPAEAPSGRPAPRSTQDGSPGATLPRRGRPRATLVEDDPVTAGLVRHRLERSGFLVEHHTDGADALAAILALPPDVVVLDVQLPSMDGFEILGRVREDPTAGAVPVLMFTSLGRQEHVQRGFELGADDYVTKPFSPTELLTRVLRLVRRR